MKSNLKTTLLGTLLVAAFALGGCSSTPDTVEDPLAAFGIDAVLPFATVAPDTVAPTPTPAPTTNPDDLTTNPGYGQEWKEDGAPMGDAPLDDIFVDEEPTPRPTRPPAQIPAPEGYPRLAYGASGSDVTKLQNRLKKLGYYTGTADGKFGAGTVSAVKRFQSIVGLSETGIATSALQEELYASSAPKYVAPATRPPAPEPTAKYVRLESGASSARVKRLQNRLRTLGYYSGTCDGNFGSGTETAVKRFQKAVGLNQTGVATVALQEKLFSSSAPDYERPVAPPEDIPDDEPDYVRLSKGSSGTRVRNLQNRLKKLGYYTGTADGRYGAGTVGAVKLFQQTLGLNVTGTATASLQKKLFASSAPAYEGEAIPDDEEYVLLSPGDSGSDVKRLQKRLKELGYFTGELGGNYQTKTTDAVRRFQEAINVNPTGVATASLQKKLFSSSAPSYDGDEPAPDPGSDYVKLQYGDSSDRVFELQSRLTDLGYYSGPLSGDFNQKTVAAVKQFEKRYDKKQTGVASVALQKKLFSEDALPSKGTDPDQPDGLTKLQKGDSGAKVKKLQRRLQELGYFTGSIGGNYQQLTIDAVKRFQNALGLTTNGTATIALQEILYSDDAPYYEGDQSKPGDQGDTTAPYKTLKKGAKGDAVIALQDRLLELGYIYDATTVSYGTYDRATMLAVIDAQNARNYDSDGVADVDFQTYLFSDAAWDYALSGYAAG
ncbi:MAG: peptidoglycan-binding protein [Clostridia bacterium]